VGDIAVPRTGAPAAWGEIRRKPPRLILAEQLGGQSLAVLSFCQQRMLPDFTLGRELQRPGKGCF
jgi:hypothetical protein